MQSKDKIYWTDYLHQDFLNTHKNVFSNYTLTLPSPSDELWIVTDGLVRQRGQGATRYAIREVKLNLAGFLVQNSENTKYM